MTAIALLAATSVTEIKARVLPLLCTASARLTGTAIDKKSLCHCWLM
jgi:hypothetical protein